MLCIFGTSVVLVNGLGLTLCVCVCKCKNYYYYYYTGQEYKCTCKKFGLVSVNDL